MDTPWILQVNEPGQPPREIPAAEGLLIGRHPDCGLLLTDSRVSGRHARIISKGQDLAILDLGSNNGTHLDGAHVLREGQDQSLRNGMLIQIGHVDIQVHHVSAEAGEPSTIFAPPGSADATVQAGGVEADEVGTQMDLTPMDEDETIGPGTIPPPSAPSPSPPPAAETPPAPAPRKAAQPNPVPAHESGFTAFDSVALNTIVAGADDAFGAQAKLVRMGARLVLVNEADLRSVPIDQIEFTIGRTPESNCSLRNRGVSSEHARIVFSSTHNLFLVEDVGSANGTQFNGAPLSPNTPRELQPDTHLRFGTFEAVFVQDVDADFQELSSARHETAVRLLKSRGLLSSMVIKQATEEANSKQIKIGEALLLGQHISPREWTKAIEEARMASTLQDLNGGRVAPWIPWAVAGLALIIVLFLLATSTGRNILNLGS